MNELPQLAALDLLLNEAEYQRLLDYGKQIVESPGNGTSATPLATGGKTGSGLSQPGNFRHSKATEDARFGSVIGGRYKLLERIGEGGMGSVWMAEQTEPIRRNVALKIIKVGIGSREIITRFEAERQSLALMNHANIARILDAGQTEGGKPFFVMELVRGLPLTAYCDRQQLGIDDRLRLFVDACSGVQHSHQKGIIHRDLKPSNILVTEIDGQAVPKVIDFGLAKAMEGTNRLIDESLATEIGQIIGTLKYMSPEQASLDAHDIDTRSDIYSLGVILYELLTGSTPLDETAVKKQPLLETLEMIRTREPVKPSSRLTSTGATISSITEQRRTDSGSLKRILVGDLDWVVIKALEIDRCRRYESASGLVADIQRFLNSEPVVARPPSPAYRIRKFVRKNRVGVVAASLLLTALLAGLAGTTWQMRRAQIAERNSEKDKKLAQANEQSAREQSQLAMSTLTSVINDIHGGLKNLSGGGEIRRRLLKTSLEKLESVATKYVAQATVDRNTFTALTELGDVVLRFGTDPFEPESKAPEQFSENLQSAVTLAEFFYTRALEIAKQLAIADPKSDVAQRDLSVAYSSLGDLQHEFGRQITEALGSYQKSLEISLLLAVADRSDGRAQRDLSVAYNNLGDVQIESGQVMEALDSFQKVFEIRQQLAAVDPSNAEAQRDLSKSYIRLGDAQLQSGQVTDGLRSYQKSLDIFQQLVEADPSDAEAQRGLPFAHQKLGDAHLRSGQVTAAMASYQMGLVIRQKLAMADPSDSEIQSGLSFAYNKLGDLQIRSGKLTEALESYQKGLENSQKLAEADLNNARAQRTLSISFEKIGDVNLRCGRVIEALGSYQKVLDILQELAVADPNSAQAQRDLSILHIKLGDVLRKNGQLIEALDSYQKSLDLFQKLVEVGPSDAGNQRGLSLVYARLGDVQFELGHMTEALETYQKFMEICQQMAAVDPSDAQAQRDLSVSFNKIGHVQVQSGQVTEALDSYQKGLKIREQLAAIDPNDAQAQRELSSLYEKLGDVQFESGRVSEALGSLQKGLEIRQQLAAADPRDVVAQRGLAVAHQGLGKTFNLCGEYDMAAVEFESGAAVLRKMIEHGMNVKVSRRELATLEKGRDSALSARIAMEDWETLMQRPVKDLPALLDTRSDILVTQERFKDAAQTVTKLRELENADNGQLYNAACSFCLCAASIKPADGESLTAEQSAQRQAWITDALDTLKQSIAAGWDDFAHMQVDSDLAILRDLAEFKALFPENSDGDSDLLK